MACPRCGASDGAAKRWCAPCERLYDAWSRQHAADIVWIVMSGGCVLATIGLAVPLLGLPWVLASAAAFLGWGTVLGLHRWNARRRRRQFLAGTLPRAYLPEPR